MIVRTASGVTLTLTRELGAGGEAAVWECRERSDQVVKIYHPHHRDRSRMAKLQAMLAAPPADPCKNLNHVSIAWPTDIVVDRAGAATGYVMPKVSGGLPLFERYNPASRLLKCPAFNWRYLHRTARNLASAVAAVHAAGHVIGDVNESNALVDERGLITLIDTDSFQIRGTNGKVLRCPVMKAEYQAPEVQGLRADAVDKTDLHDRFGLAVLLFLLLNEGRHPFSGKYQGPGNPPQMGDAIKQGFFIFGRPATLMRPPAIAVPIDALAPPLENLFRLAFEKGHSDASVRPRPSDWITALDEAEADLRVCKSNPNHVFHPRRISCVWCDRTNQFGMETSFAPPPGSCQRNVIPRQVPLPPAGSAAGGLGARRATPPQRVAPNVGTAALATATAAKGQTVRVQQRTSQSTSRTSPLVWVAVGVACLIGVGLLGSRTRPLSGVDGRGGGGSGPGVAAGGGGSTFGGNAGPGAAATGAGGSGMTGGGAGPGTSTGGSGDVTAPSVLEWVADGRTLLDEQIFVYPPGIASGRPGRLLVLSDGLNVAAPDRNGRWQFWKLRSITYERYGGGLGFVLIRFDPVLSGAPELRLKPQDGDTDSFFARFRSVFAKWAASDLGRRQLAASQRSAAALSTVTLDSAGGPSEPTVVPTAPLVDIAPPTPGRDPDAKPPETYEVAHRHGMGGFLGDVLRDMNSGNASPNFCIGVLELTGEGFRFHTTATRDNRRDTVSFAYLKIKKVERKNQNALHIDTVKNNWDFFAEPDVVNKIEQSFRAHAEEFAQKRR